MRWARVWPSRERKGQSADSAGAGHSPAPAVYSQARKEPGAERGRDCFLGESMRREGRWLLKPTRLTTTGHLAHGTCTLGSMCQKGQRKGTLSTQLHACLWAGIPLTHLLG